MSPHIASSNVRSTRQGCQHLTVLATISVGAVFIKVSAGDPAKRKPERKNTISAEIADTAETVTGSKDDNVFIK